MFIIYIKHNNLTAGTKTFKPKTHGEEFVLEMKITSEIIFTKSKANALTNESFAKFIKENDINEFIVTGADASACVKSTTYNMAKSGYKTYVLSDCFTSYNKKFLPELIEYYTKKGCTVCRLEQLMKNEIKY